MGLPLIDLHRHLEGSFRPETVAELTEHHRHDGPREVDAARRLIQVPGQVATLVDYLRGNDHAVRALADLPACARVAAEAVEDAAAEGWRIWSSASVRSSWPDHAAWSRQKSSPRSSTARVPPSAPRGCGPPHRDNEPHVRAERLHTRARALLTQSAEISALDLAGDEARWPAPWPVRQQPEIFCWSLTMRMSCST